MRKNGILVVAALTALAVFLVQPSVASTLSCRKVVASEASGEGRNALKASRVKCADDEFLTGGTCYPAERPQSDGSCQTSAMGIIQTLADSPNTTAGAFYTCLQTGGSDCPVEERTQAMAICCKLSD
ncbi:MAG: hypothetical protein VCA74_03785 [Deltaproteobacteria bacterium]